MDRAAVELFLAALYVEGTPERQEALRLAASAARNWEGLVSVLDGHGLLLLFLRNLDQAGLEIPHTLEASLQARAGQLRSEQQRARLTLKQFLQTAAYEGLEVTLVGGTALSFEPHALTDLRRPGPLELRVDQAHFSRALTVARQVGLLPGEASLPTWWHRLTRLPLRLLPTTPLLQEAELSTVLHHPSLLLTASTTDIDLRRGRLLVEGLAAQVLDPIDRLLDLSVRIATRAGAVLLQPGRSALAAASSSGNHPLRVGWVLDLAQEIERRHATHTVADVLARAQEWSAEPALCAALQCIQSGLGFSPPAREWARAVALGLARVPARVPPRLPGATSSLVALFRPDPIERLPHWAGPSEDYLARRFDLDAQASLRDRRLARARHLADLATQGALAAALWPPALLARRLGRDSSRRAWAGATSPQRLSEIKDAWRAEVLLEKQKPLAPRTVSLPEPEEGRLRLPDRYLG